MHCNLIINPIDDGKVLEVKYPSSSSVLATNSARRASGCHHFLLKDQSEEGIATNIDGFDIWADQAGQHTLYLLAFLDGLICEKAEVPGKTALDPDVDQALKTCSTQNSAIYLGRELAIIAAAVAFLSKRTSILQRLKPKTYSTMLHHYYLQSEKSSFGFIKRDAAERWITFCMDDPHADYDWFKNSNTCREKELREAIERINKLPKKEDPPSAQPEQKERACSWFLRWYDLKQAADLSFNGWRRSLVLWTPEFLALVALFYVAVGPLYLDSWIGFLYIWNLAPFIYLACLVALVITLIVAYRTARAGRNRYSRRWQVLLPRLAAGITVGYFALLNADAWLGIFDPRLFGPECRLLSAPVLIRVLLPLVAVFGYIYIEIGRRPGIQMNALKAFWIFCRGYAYSILLGLLFSDIFGASLLRDAPASPYALQGAVGFIHPQVILYIAPLAYFIGLFLQLLWEDKSLTEGI